MEAFPMNDIVLVEDDEHDLELMLRAFQRVALANPIKVLRDGAEAVDYFFNTKDGAIPRCPRVVLLDLKLPKISGLDVLARLKGDERTRPIPVVVVTSSREGPDIERAYALGANSYIVKPVDFEKFADAVSQLGLYWLLLNEPDWSR